MKFLDKFKINAFKKIQPHKSSTSFFNILIEKKFNNRKA